MYLFLSLYKYIVLQVSDGTRKGQLCCPWSPSWKMTGQGVKPGLLLLPMLLEGGEDLSHLWGELRSAAATYPMVTTGPMLRNTTSQDSLGLWSLELPQGLSWTPGLCPAQLSIHKPPMACNQALLPQEWPSKGQAAQSLPYHMEELEEIHVGIQSVFHPL